MLVTCSFRVSCFCSEKGKETTTFSHTVLRQPQPRILAVICCPLQTSCTGAAANQGFEWGKQAVEGTKDLALEGAAMRPGRGLVFGVGGLIDGLTLPAKPTSVGKPYS